jgi:hypothetical protein
MRASVTFFFIGVGLGFAAAALFSRLPAERERRAYAVGLLVAALIYVGFAWLQAPPSWRALEVLGVLIFGWLASRGTHGSAGYLVVGWLAHVAWDVGLHAPHKSPFVPAWYPGLCAGFDIVVAWCIARRSVHWPPPAE